VGLEIRDAVLQQKLATPETVMLAYAESVGLPYIDLEEIGVAEDLVPLVAPAIARQHSCVPVMVDGERLLMASPNPLVPDVEEDLRLRTGMPVRTVLCTPAGITAMIAKYYSGEARPMTPAPTPAAKQQAQPAAAAAPSPAHPVLSPEEQAKRRMMVALIAFNIGVILTIVLAVMYRGGMGLLGMLDFVLAFVVGTIAAGAAFGLSTMLK
jgi:hypothetical protein